MNRINQKGSRKLDKPIPLLEHFDELRKGIIYSAIAVVICAAGAYSFIGNIFTHLARPVGNLVFLSPPEAFVSRIKLTIFSGIFISSPLVLYQIWHFIQKGLLVRERKHILPLTCLSFLLFILGSSFGYFVIFPIGIRFLLSYGTESLIPMISVSRYLSFLFCLVFSFGLIFELPLIIGFLSKIGVIQSQTLKAKRRFAILAIFIIAAILTPPDIFTQLLLAGPLLVLYEISIYVACLIEGRR